MPRLFPGVPCLPIRVQFVCLCPSPSHPCAIYVCVSSHSCALSVHLCSLFVHPLAFSVFLSASAPHLSLVIPCLLAFLSIHEFVLSLYAPSCLSAPLLVHPWTPSVHLSVSMPVCPSVCPVCPPLCPTCSFTCPFCPYVQPCMFLPFYMPIHLSMALLVFPCPSSDLFCVFIKSACLSHTFSLSIHILCPV